MLHQATLTTMSDPIDGKRNLVRTLAWSLAVGTCVVFWTSIGLLIVT